MQETCVEFIFESITFRRTGVLDKEQWLVNLVCLVRQLDECCLVMAGENKTKRPEQVDKLLEYGERSVMVLHSCFGNRKSGSIPTFSTSRCKMRQVFMLWLSFQV